MTKRKTIDPRAPPLPDIPGSIAVEEEGTDHVHIQGYGVVPPPGTVIDAKPPTDARMTHRGRIRQRNLERLHAKAVARRDTEQEATARTPKLLPHAAARWPEHNIDLGPRLRTIFVRPSDPRRVVFDLRGRAYPVDGISVPANDAYISRRLRDGSLVRVEPP